MTCIPPINPTQLVTGGKFKSVNVRHRPDLKSRVFTELPAGIPVEGVKIGEFWAVTVYLHDTAVSIATAITETEIPYISQIEGDADYGNDCNMACLAMVLAWRKKIVMSPDQITLVFSKNPGWNPGWKIGQYTTFSQGIRFLDTHGISSETKKYLVTDVPPVGSIALIRYSALDDGNAYDKRFYRSAGAYHFVVVTGADSTKVFVHDPLWRAGLGVNRAWSRREWNRAFTGHALVTRP
jgi:Peptidase_C39 like family